MAKQNVYEAIKSSNCKTRNAAMVMLNIDGEVDISTLANLTGLALSTVRKYLKKFANLINYAREHFILIVKNIKCAITSKIRYYCYIDKIEMPNGEVWTKIGKTTVSPERRAKGFEWGSKDNKIKPKKVTVLKKFTCKDEKSMTTLENLLRYAMTSINPLKFEMNDRLLDWQENYCDIIVNHPDVQSNLASLLAA